jgi:hypothetical protein
MRRTRNHRFFSELSMAEFENSQEIEDRILDDELGFGQWDFGPNQQVDGPQGPGRALVTGCIGGLRFKPPWPGGA